MFLKKSFLFLLIFVFLFSIPASASEEQSSAPLLIEANLITEVLEWGETITGIRLEYSEEIDCSEVKYSAENPAQVPYTMLTDRDIINIYVNNTGKKGEIEQYGSYVFLDLGLKSEDPFSYRDQVTFNTSTKDRPAQSPYYLVSVDLETRSGNTIKGGSIVTSGEIRIGIDDFTTFVYTDDSGNELYYHLYIPDGYEEGNNTSNPLPLVVHYPSNDYLYTDYTGTYQGSLFTHPDCTIWASEEVQSETPCFVVSIGSPVEKADWKASYEDSWLQQAYATVIRLLTENYAIDSSRIYGISLAAGSYDLWNTIIANPDLFAAELITSSDYTVYEEPERLEKAIAVSDLLPTWYFIGFSDESGNVHMNENDNPDRGIRILEQLGEVVNEGHSIYLGYGKEGEEMWNGMLRGEEAEEQALAFLKKADSTGSNNYLTLYMPGTLSYSMHWTWNATYSNSVIRSWLFSQTKAS